MQPPVAPTTPHPVPAQPAPASAAPPPQRHRILMVSDFFYPNFGGVENHIYQLSQCLISQGHKVVVMTHAYGDCGGVRYLTNGLKVYYVYRTPIHAQSTLPTWVGCFRLLRLICLREAITLVHAHQAFSSLGGEALLAARTMGYQVVFTDHSLFGFADAASILTNKLIKGLLADVGHVICVSHTSKENTVLRACLRPAAVSVIPNAVDASEFEPDPAKPWPSSSSTSPITIVALSRLVYRKGIDIMALVIPEVCHRHPNVNFVIGGGGPKRALLEQMVAQEGLQQRVSLAGPIPHERARDFLLQGHIFVNASLTEAFCMAIVEAASAGLLVVSTRVGGVPEVLPPDMMLLAEPSPEDLLAALEEAILRVPSLEPVQQHERVKGMYNWPNVAQRTAAVYDRLAAAAAATAPAGASPIDVPTQQLLPRLRRYRGVGAWAGLVLCCIVVWLHCFWRLLEWQQPAGEVDDALDWPSQARQAALQQQCQPAAAGSDPAGGSSDERRRQQRLPAAAATMPPPQRQQQQQQQHQGRPRLRQQQQEVADGFAGGTAGPSSRATSGTAVRYNLRSTVEKIQQK